MEKLHRLFLRPGACSLSCHIALEESGIPFEIIDLAADSTPESVKAEFLAINPLGAVPVLQLPNGHTLTQNLAIHTYLSELKPNNKLMPSSNPEEHAHAYEWLSFVASDLHKAYSPLFIANDFPGSDETRNEFRKWATHNLDQYLTHANTSLEGKDYLLGSTLCSADIYLFVVYNWNQILQVSSEKYSNLNAHKRRIFDRPATQRAMKREGLIKPNS